MNLLIEQKSKGETTKVWRLRPGGKIVTVGQSRNADLRTTSQDVHGIFGAFEYRDDGVWTYTQLAPLAKPITSSGDVCVELQKPFSISTGDIEFFITPVDFKAQLFTDVKVDGDEKGTWALIYSGNIFLESKLIRTGEALIFADTEMKLSPTENWSEQVFGNYTVKSRIISLPKTDNLDKGTREDYFEKGQERYMYGTLIAIGLLAALIITGQLTKEKPVEVVSVQEFTTQVVAKKPEEKKAPKENAVTKAMAQAVPPESASGGGGKTVGSVISKIRTASLSNLIAKVSAQGKRSANVVITNKGESAASSTPTGRAMAALSKVTGQGTDWRAEGKGSGIGSGLSGLGGSKGAKYGDLNAGKTGTGGVGLIEDESEIVGGLDREVIAAYIRSQLGQILFCYERQLSANPDLFGKVAVKFTIGGDGQVMTQNIGETSLRNQNVESCILQKVSHWKFPKPDGGTKVVVTYPFLFKSTN